MFTDIETARLRLRAYTADDAAQFAALRDHPDAARYQNWARPYTEARAAELLASIAAEPTADEWWHVAVEDRTDGRYVGDVCVGFSNGLRSAEIGFTFQPAVWGQGYALEAVAAVVAHLFATVDPTRVFGMLHPDNHASAMLLERLGLRYEGHTRASFWLGDDNSDDLIYGMTRSDWDDWQQRRRNRPTSVELVAVTADNAGAVRRLVTHKSQERFVAPMLDSFADALYPEPWDGIEVIPVQRAIVADGEIVGFVMYAAGHEQQPEPYLWRLLVDRRHQRRGVGRQALRALYDELRATGATAMTVSWAPGRGSPEPLYLSEGFVPTGVVEDGEHFARKLL